MIDFLQIWRYTYPCKGLFVTQLSYQKSKQFSIVGALRHIKSRLDSEAGKGWILEQVNRIVKMQPGLSSFQLVIEIKSPTMRTLVFLLYSDRQMSMTLCTKVFPNIRSTSSDIRMRTSGSHGTT